MFKLRIYHTKGSNKGNLKREEFFNTMEEMKNRYSQLFKYELCPGRFDSVKSFYGKAKVIEKDSGETVLQSYNTEVCKINASGEFVRLWSGYSATTMRHINAFIELFDIPGGGKC